MKGRELHEFMKPVLNRRVDVLLKDTNPKYDIYVEQILDQLNVRGTFTTDEWFAKVNELIENNRVKVKEII